MGGRDNISTEEYLQNTLSYMKNKLIKNNDSFLAQEKANAKKLQDFFNAIGTRNYSPENFIAEKEVQQIQEKLQALGLGAVWNFNNIKGTKNITNTAFEKYLSSLVKNVMKKAEEQNWIELKGRSYNLVIGKENVSILKNIEDDLVTDTLTNLVKETYKEEGERIKGYADETKRIDHANVNVQGKIDVGFNFSFDITVNMPDELKEIFNLLSDATFSAKAYATLRDVEIGHTNSFRVFMATTQGNTENKIYHWYRMLSCMDHHDYHEAALLFYQIRYIYELTGYGQQYIKEKINQVLGNSTGAKYLIYFNPGSGVQVLSTAVIIHNFLEMVEDGTYFEKYASKYAEEGKNYSKEYALGAKLKMRMNQNLFELDR